MKDVIRSWWRGAGPLVAALVLAAGLPAVPADAQFSESTSVVVVEVPVQVVGKDGEPVRGLTANDFEVFEGRKKLPVTGFEVMDLKTSEAASNQMPTAARRHFMMLFDLSFSEPQAILKARAAAENVIRTLHPTDLVAVATYNLASGPQLVLGFTPDRVQVQSALHTLGLPELVERSIDPLRLVLSQQQDAMGAANTGGMAEKKSKDATDEAVLEQLQSFANESDKANAIVLENKVKSLTRSFTDLARVMAGIQGRKYVVYLSEGFDSSLLLGTGSEDDQAAMSEASASGEIWNVDSDKRYGSTSSTNAVEAMLESFRRADCTIQAVDIGGLRGSGEVQGGSAGRGKDALLQMAKGTGGELYENFNDLSAAMGKMLERTSVTYVLAVQPEGLKQDGAYHKLRVELKGKNGRVIHRPGYYAPRPVAQQNPMERLLSAASEIMNSEDAGTVSASVMAAPFRVPGSDGAYVPVLIEVDGPSLMAGKQGATMPTEIFVYAMDQNGSVQDFLTQTLGLDMAKVEGPLRQGGLKFFGHLSLPAGQYSIRTLVRNGNTGAYGLRIVPLEVPAWTGAGPVLLPPFFPEAPGKWLMIREQGRDPQKPVPYPFMAKDQPYIPSSMPVLGAGQEAAVSLVGYNLGSGDVQVRAQIFGADGKEVAPGEMKVLGRESAAGVDRLQTTFRAPALQPGQYTLQVTLSAGGQSDTSTARFVVKG